MSTTVRRIPKSTMRLDKHLRLVRSRSNACQPIETLRLSSLFDIIAQFQTSRVGGAASLGGIYGARNR